MEYRRVGASGLQVSEIGLGSWLTLGSSVDGVGSSELVHRAFDLGVNFFDTADVYANGSAEEALGRAVRELPRHHLVLASKCFFAVSERANDRGLSRKHIVESVEGSLRRLGTDYLDLYQCHRSDPDVPMDETVRAYEDLIRQGKLLYWGVSLWSGAEVARACQIADRVRRLRLQLGRHIALVGLNLRQHVVEAVDQDAQLVVTVLGRPDGIDLVPCDGFHRFRQMHDRLRDHLLQPP